MLDANPAMKSVQGELVPYLLRKQYSVYETDTPALFGGLRANENKLALASQLSSADAPWAPGPAGLATNLHCHATIVGGGAA